MCGIESEGMGHVTDCVCVWGGGGTCVGAVFVHIFACMFVFVCARVRALVCVNSRCVLYCGGREIR